MMQQQDFIPEEEREIDPKKLVPGRERCHRKMCKPGPTTRNPDKEREDFKTVAQLRYHYRTTHLGKKDKIPSQTWIPADGKVEADALTIGRGVCFMCIPEEKGGKKLERLKQHFVGFHLNQQVKCPDCGEEVAYGYLSTHRKIHSGPVKCSYCDVRSSSEVGFEHHRSDKHRDVPGITFIKLIGIELEDYYREKDEAKERTQRRHEGRYFVYQGKEKVQEYEKYLRDEDHHFHQSAQSLKLKFEEWFDLPFDPLTSLNSGFISVWNPKGRIPFLVFEKVGNIEKCKDFGNGSFYRDPKIPASTQPAWNEYRLTGYEQGHLAPAANYPDLLEFMSSFYFSNVVPMSRELNFHTRLPLEKHIRETARKNETVWAAHFPIFEGEKEYLPNSTIRIPSSVATVAITKKDGKYTMEGWELPNNFVRYHYEQRA